MRFFEKFFLDFKMLHFISALEYATIGEAGEWKPICI